LNRVPQAPGHSSRPPLLQIEVQPMTLQLAEDTLFAHRFGATTPFQVGVEEELFLVDPSGHHVRSCTDELLADRPARFTRGRVMGEMCDGVVELATPVCASADEALDALGQLRRDVLARDRAALMGAGMHPTAPFGGVTHRAGAHYDAVADDVRGLLRQSVVCGVHVHVGMPDPETAVIAFNGMRKWVPVLQALGANSPFWHGQDSGLQSCRTARFHMIPRTGLPRAFRDWADYTDTMRELIRVSGIEGPGSLWWDVRPHPSLGTLEVRVLDAQSSLDSLRGLVALIHCLALHEATIADDRHAPKELLDEACHHAIRDGLDARLSVGGPMQHMQALARQALDIAHGYAHELRCVEALPAAEALLSGNGADRQRRAYAAGGMDAVVEHLVAETATVRKQPRGEACGVRRVGSGIPRR
jgi:glutamate---cysteine ligase / carboxylate-amine ligase